MKKALDPEGKQLEDLEVGNLVAMRYGQAETWSILPVQEQQKPDKRFVQVNGEKFRRADGGQVKPSGRWSGYHTIEPVTKTIRLANRRAELVNKLSHYDHSFWKTFLVDSLEVIDAAIERAKEKEREDAKIKDQTPDLRE